MSDFLKNIPFDQLKIGDQVIDGNRKYGEIIKLSPSTKEIVVEWENEFHFKMAHPYCGSMYYIGQDHNSKREPISFEDFFDSMDDDFKKSVEEEVQRLYKVIRESKI